MTHYDFDTGNLLLASGCQTDKVCQQPEAGRSTPRSVASESLRRLLASTGDGVSLSRGRSPGGDGSHRGRSPGGDERHRGNEAAGQHRGLSSVEDDTDPSSPSDLISAEGEDANDSNPQDANQDSASDSRRSSLCSTPRVAASGCEDWFAIRWRTWDTSDVLLEGGDEPLGWPAFGDSVVTATSTAIGAATAAATANCYQVPLRPSQQQQLMLKHRPFQTLPFSPSRLMAALDVGGLGSEPLGPWASDPHSPFRTLPRVETPH